MTVDAGRLIENPVKLIIHAVELGRAIHKRYQVYSTADAGKDVLGDRLRVSFFVLDAFKEFVQDGIGSLHFDLQEAITRFVEHLQDIFMRLDSQLHRFPPDQKLTVINKLRWTFGGKSGYDALLLELKEWKEETEHVITALKLCQDREKPPALYKRLFETTIAVQRADMMDDVLHARSGLREAEPTLEISLLGGDIFSDGNRRVSLYNTDPVYIENKYFESRSAQELQHILSDLRLLASVLQRADAASMHILPCIGTVYQEEYKRALLVFRIPSMPPANSNWTLATSIQRSPKPPLEVRIRFSVEICQAILYTHATGLVHRSVRPDNVLLLASNGCSSPAVTVRGTSGSLNAWSVSPSTPLFHRISAFLVGYDVARPRDAAAYSDQLAEPDRVRRLYHHPERQSETPDGRVVRFGIRHDMYSLGVLLIELGLWVPLRRISVTLKELGSITQPFDANRLHEELISVVENKIAANLGSRYASAVLCCLQETIDLEKAGKENELRELFYETVLRHLMKIVV